MCLQKEICIQGDDQTTRNSKSSATAIQGEQYEQQRGVEHTADETESGNGTVIPQLSALDPPVGLHSTA